MSEWVTESLNQLVTFQKGRKVDTSSYQKIDYEPYLGAGALSGNFDGYASTEFAVKANANDVLMLWDGERSGLVGVNLQGIVASTVSKLTPNNKIISWLLFYLLKLNFEWIQNRRTGTGVPHVPKDLGRILEIKYPTNKVLQHKLANILQTIDQTIESTQALIEKYQLIKTGLMHDLFTRGIGADGKLRPPRGEAPELYQETAIGWIPKEWEVKPILAYASVIDPNPSHRNPVYHPEGFPFISTIEFEDFDRIELDTSRRVIEAIVLEQESRCQFNKHSIAFSRKGTIGETRFLPDHIRFALLDSLCVINPKSIDAFFLFYALRSYILKRQINNMTVGQALPQMSIGRVRELVIATPINESEQQNVVARLKKIDDFLSEANQSLEKLRKQKAGLMHDLLTGKVQVKVDDEESDTAIWQRHLLEKYL